jgi:Fe2+ or Zn2+ uptake regulation protein
MSRESDKAIDRAKRIAILSLVEQRAHLDAEKVMRCICGNAVSIEVASGGTRYEKTMYSVVCQKCGVIWEDCVPSNCSGRRADAIREWNKSQREKIP